MKSGFQPPLWETSHPQGRSKSRSTMPCLIASPGMKNYYFFVDFAYFVNRILESSAFKPNVLIYSIFPNIFFDDIF